MKRFVSLKTKLIFLSAFLVVFCTVLIGGYVVIQLPTITINSVGGDYINILASVSKTIDMDKFAGMKSTDVDSDDYKTINENLFDAKELLGLNHLYLLKMNAGGEFFQFSGKNSETDAVSGATGVVDAVSGATAVSQSSTVITDAMKKSFQGEEQFELQDNPKWGKLFSIYYPLKDSTGKTIGVLVANLNGEPIYQSFNVVRSRILIIGLFILSLGIVISIIFSGFMVKSLNLFMHHAERIGKGDLTANIEINRRDEIGLLGKSFNNLNNALSNIIGAIREKSGELNEFASHLASISESIAYSSEETTQSISEIATGANRQAEELLFISNKLGDFNNSVQKIYDSLEATRENAEITNTLSTEGNVQLQGLNQSIVNTSESFDIVADRINKLSRNAQQIDEINTAIENIATQTNLLALNAAIEASRAGEAGKGFTVVSDEIRKLAIQSKDSSDKIRMIVDEIMSSVESVVTTSNDAKLKLEEQIKFIENTNKAFTNIIKSLEEAIPVLNEAFNSADEMIRNKNIIFEKIEAVTAVSQQTSAGAQEILRATETISAQTEEIAAFSKTLHDSADGLYSQTRAFKIKEQ
ncbi:MAG TPA: methyl-accepting chemotaxis protein [Clostridiaceae bacterium]|nr:methyl-accepting chemotaxis protein [Clostridiaceae bacterium]